jgi:hypothetical protein
VDEGRYRAAQAVAAEMQGAVREALADGYILVLPTTPGPAPRAPLAKAGRRGSSSSDGGGEEEEGAVEAFRQRCAEFAAVAALAGAPQAVLPLPLPGEAPLSVSLLGLHRRDLALAQAAARLGPLLAQEAAAAEQQGRGEEATDWQPRADAAGAAAAAPPRRNGRRKGANGADGAEAAAEACKEAGNSAFRAGRYEEAVRQYSAAIQLCPRAAVYLANRAMAHLRLGAYGAAEVDCDAALKLELGAKALLRRGSARLAQVGPRACCFRVVCVWHGVVRWGGGGAERGTARPPLCPHTEGGEGPMPPSCA